MKLIGKGAFTKAYLDKNRVYLRSNDTVKECMVNGWLEESRLFPKIKHSKLARFDYEMKYYPRVNLRLNLRPRQYRLYRELYRVYTCGYEVDHYKMFSKVKSEFNREVGYILDYYNSLVSLLGKSVRFEISPRNVAVTEKGSLILLDCFYNEEFL